jgi:dTDP-glucose 4,6-dehydratase
LNNILEELSGKNVIVTGADGFVGSHLCEFLVSQGANVTALIRRNSAGTFKNVNSFKKKLKVRWGDARDFSIVDEICKNQNIIFHLAAQTHVGYSLYNPYETVLDNTISTMNVLEATRKYDISRLIHAGSSEIFGDPTNVPINEKNELNPRSPYAAAKAGAEHLLKSYYYSYNLPIVNSRFFNIYGPKQGLDQVIPKFILQALNNKNLTVYGEGKQTRDYTYVKDAVYAYSLLAVKPKIEGMTINFGTGKEIKIKDLANMILKLTKSKSKLVFDKKLRKGETPRLLCDPNLAYNLLKWKTSFTLEKGISETIEYFQDKKELISNLPYML